jgi:hypothetical protein
MFGCAFEEFKSAFKLKKSVGRKEYTFDNKKIESVFKCSKSLKNCQNALLAKVYK